MKKVYAILTALTIACAWHIQTDARATIDGTISFPDTVTTPPIIRLYHCGRKLVSEQRGNTVTFSIRKEQNVKQMFLLIASRISPIGARRNETPLVNTVDHLAVPENLSYKFYSLVLEEKTGHWAVAGTRALNTERQIPDNTIIVLWDPNTIASVSGETATDSLRITCRDDIISFFGSEQKLQECAAKIQLEAINSDLFHETPTETVKLVVDKCRVLRVCA